MKNQNLAEKAVRPGLQVNLPAFSGPFDLLIYLVERDKVDIHQIAIAEITSSYIESLKMMQQFDPDVGSDFIYMAAYLLELKSRSLLPRYGRLHLEQQPDPREELIMRLVEYKRFRELAACLEEMAQVNARVFTRPPALPAEAGVRPLAPMSLDNLYSAYCRAMNKARSEVRHLPPRTIAVSQMIKELRSRLAKGRVVFSELAGPTVMGKVVTFLALLELVRLGEAVVRQPALFAPIYIEPVKRDVDEQQ